MKRRLKIIGGNLSRLVCSLTGGHPWETLSGRAWRLKLHFHWSGDFQVWLYDGICRRFRMGHCQKHWEFEQKLRKVYEK